jgi:aminobenzoyl-glutamate utilization protein A
MHEQIREYSEKIRNKLIEIRRDIHKYPEAGWTEFRTSTIIAEYLDDLGYEITVGRDIVSENDRLGVSDEKYIDELFNEVSKDFVDSRYLHKMEGGFTGVVGDIRKGKDRTIALRFDIDALKIKESEDNISTEKGFSSVKGNLMHACGHDAHIAIGLGVSAIIRSINDDLDCNIKLIFQPAEEGVRGAYAMVKAGILDDVDYLLGIHVTNDLKVGEVECGLGGYFATTKFDAEIIGNPAHSGGTPELGNNSLLAASTAVLNMHSIPRHSKGITRINVGMLSAGTDRNVIPDNAKLNIETRGENTELDEYMLNAAHRILINSAEMYGCTVDIKIMGKSDTSYSSNNLTEYCEKVIDENIDLKLCRNIPSLGSEDIAMMMNKVQDDGGKAVVIGVGSNPGFKSRPHTGDFAIDEECIHKTSGLLSSLVYEIAKIDSI